MWLPSFILEGDRICNDFDVLTHKKKWCRTMTVGNVDVSAIVGHSISIPIDVEVSPALDGVGAVGYRKYKVSDDSYAGHDMSFRLLIGFIPHQQVYYIMCTHINARR